MTDPCCIHVWFAMQIKKLQVSECSLDTRVDGKEAMEAGSPDRGNLTIPYRCKGFRI